MKKIVACAMAFIFFVTTSAVSESYKIPRKYGRVVGRYGVNGANKTVFLIQDAHTVFEAQRNIAEIIKSFVNNGHILVCVEGACGELDFSEIRAFPYKDILKEVSIEYLADGKIVGSEYSKITSDKDFILYGAENKLLFREDFSLFYKAGLNKFEVEDEILKIEELLNSLKKTVFNEKLYHFDEVMRNSGDIKAVLPEIYKYVDNFKINLLQYLNLLQFKEIFLIENSIDYKKLEDEIDGILGVCDDKLKPDGKNIDYFIDMLIRRKMDFSCFPNINKCYLCRKKRKLIDYKKFLDEVYAIGYEIRRSLARNDTERELVNMLEAYEKFKKLIFLNIRNSELTDVEKNVNTVEKFLDKYFPNRINFLKIKKQVNLNLAFYSKARKRDVAIVKNLLDKMNETGVDIAMLVAGGFHKNGIVKELKKADINVVCVLPNISELRNDIPYFDRMTGKLFRISPAFINNIQALGFYISDDLKEDMEMSLVVKLLKFVVIDKIYDVDNIRKAITEWNDSYVSDMDIKKLISIILKNEKKIKLFINDIETADISAIRNRLSTVAELEEFKNDMLLELNRIYENMKLYKERKQIKNIRDKKSVKFKLYEYFPGLTKYIISVMLVLSEVFMMASFDSLYGMYKGKYTSVVNDFRYGDVHYTSGDAMLDKEIAVMFNELLVRKKRDKSYDIIMEKMWNRVTKNDFLYFVNYIRKHTDEYEQREKIKDIIYVLSRAYRVSGKDFSNDEKKEICEVVSEFMLKKYDSFLYLYGSYLLERLFKAEGVEYLIKVLENGAIEYSKSLKKSFTDEYYSNEAIYNAIHMVRDIDAIFVGEQTIKRINEALIRLVAYPNDKISYLAFDILQKHIGIYGLFSILNDKEVELKVKLSIVKRMAAIGANDGWENSYDEKIFNIMFDRYMNVYGKYGDKFDLYVIFGVGTLTYDDNKENVLKEFLKEVILNRDNDVLKQAAALMLLKHGEYNIIKTNYNLVLQAFLNILGNNIDVPFEIDYRKCYYDIAKKIGYKTLPLGVLPRLPDVVAGGMKLESIETIFKVGEFQKFSEKMNIAEKITFARTIEIILARFGKRVNMENVKRIVPLLYEERVKQMERVLIDGNSRAVIALNDDDKIFSSKDIKSILRKFGKNVINDDDIIVGPERKAELLKKIADSKYNLIWFYGHGGKDHLGLSNGNIGDEESDKMHLKNAISYVELADALYSRVKNGGKLDNLVMIVNACYSSDSMSNVMNRLADVLAKKGVKSFPVIVVAAGHGTVAYQYELGNTVKDAAAGKSVVTVGDLDRMRSWVWQNIFVFVPTSDIFWNKLERVLKKGENLVDSLDKTLDKKENIYFNNKNNINLMRRDLPILEVKNEELVRKFIKVATLPQTYNLAYKIKFSGKDIPVKLAPLVETFGVLSKFIMKRELSDISWFDKDLWNITFKAPVANMFIFGISYFFLNEISLIISIITWNVTSILFGMSHSNNKLGNIFAGYIFNMPLFFIGSYLLHKIWNKNSVSKEKPRNDDSNVVFIKAVNRADAVNLNEEIQNAFLSGSGETGFEERLEEIVSGGDKVNLFVTKNLQEKLIENRNLLNRLNMFDKFRNINVYYEENGGNVAELLGNVQFKKLSDIDKKNLVILSHIGDSRKYNSLVYEFNFLDEDEFINSLVLFEAVIIELIEIASGKHKFLNPYLLMQGKENLVRLNNELVIKRKLIPAIVKTYLYNKFIKSAA